MYSRFCQNNHHTDDKCEGDQNRRIAGSHLRADLIADRHEADGDSHQKHHQTDKSECDSEENLHNLLLRQMEHKLLKNCEEADHQ